MIIQTPSMPLPGNNWGLWTEGDRTQTTNVYYSRQWKNEQYTEVTMLVKCQEVVAAGSPGPLWLWIETSPFPTVLRDDWPKEAFTSFFTWAVIGGGVAVAPGADNIPLDPTIVVPSGVTANYQNIELSFNTHHTWARLAAWDPTAATPVTDYWFLQGFLTAKGG